MDNLNDGSVVDFDKIEDYRKAARDFSEGNKSLEQLLLNCFDKGIKTTACCGGHEDKRRNPYISFSYSYENEQYIYLLMSRLRDSGFMFRYNKLSNGKSFISIEESQGFDFSKNSMLFDDINNVINSFDKERDYYSELPLDLQKYATIVKSSENDAFLKADGMSDCFQVCYDKVSDGYEYTVFTSDSYYGNVTEKAGFTKNSANSLIPSYTLIVPHREMAIQGLNTIATNVQTFGNKEEENSTSQDSQLVESKENKLEVSFEYDERTKSNPLINHLKVDSGDSIEIVAEKLRECCERGINAFTIFNGVEIDNYKSSDPQQIIESYVEGRNRIQEMMNKEVINQNQYEQNHQTLSSVEGTTHSRDRNDSNEAINERLDSIEQDKENSQSIEVFGQDLTDQNRAYEHFTNMRDLQRQQDQVIRQQQLGQLSQQDVHQVEVGGMRK